MVFWPKRSFPREILFRRFGLKLPAKISPGGARRPAGGELARRVVAPDLVGLAGGGQGCKVNCFRVSLLIINSLKKSGEPGGGAGEGGGVHAGVGQYAVPRDRLGVGRLRVVAPLSQGRDAANLFPEQKVH